MEQTSTTAAADLPPIPEASGIFAQPSALPFQAPDFSAIKDEDYQPAIEQGIAIKLAEIAHIAGNPEAPTFANTIEAMERTGQMFGRAYAVFGQLVSANTNATLDAADTALSPQIAAMWDAIYLNEALFARVKAVHDAKDTLDLSEEQAMLLETTYADFVHRGALLDDAAKEELRDINSRLSSLQTSFNQSLKEATNEAALLVETREELSGLSEAQIAAAAKAAKERGHEGKFLLTVQNTTQQAQLAVLDNRQLREKLYLASITRTSHGGEHDTRATVREMVSLRARKAALFGEDNFASWQMYDRMVDGPAGALDFLNAMVPALADTQGREAQAINERIAQDGHNFTVEPWDWPYYAEKIRQERYDLDESAIKQYFEVDRVLEDGVFYMANKLYGVSFEKRDDIPAYHEDVSVYLVRDKDGSDLALFYFDPFARPSKQGGAWMSNFIEQSHLLGDLPVITNTQNVAPPPEGEPALASFDDVITMFHEFGHALHGMFADQQYPSLSGTNTARDWVEFPSQFHENFATIPEVLRNYARHWQTGETIPMELVEAIARARKFDQGYAMGEALTGALLDMDWHHLAAGQTPENVEDFEAKALENLDLHTELVPPRYRSTYFSHIFGGGYAAGYYSYLYTEMLHHDAYDFVAQNGGMTREMGERIRDTFLSRGHSRPYEKMYRDFTGRDPQVEPMLKARGLMEA